MLHKNISLVVRRMRRGLRRLPHNAILCTATAVADSFWTKYKIRGDGNRMRFPSITCDFERCDGRRREICRDLPKCTMRFTSLRNKNSYA